MKLDDIHILTDEQLVQMAQEGSETAEEMLLEKYKGLVKNKPNTYFIVGAESEDVVQEGMIGLFRAIRSYDGRRRVLFRTYAEQCINHQILTAIKNANRLKHQPLNESISISRDLQSETAGDDGGALENILMDAHANEPESQVMEKEMVEFLRSCHNDEAGDLFSPFERQVLREKLRGLSYVEIARTLDKTPKSVDNALQRIKKKLLAYLEG